jgi:hypothetical protein
LKRQAKALTLRFRVLSPSWLVIGEAPGVWPSHDRHFPFEFFVALGDTSDTVFVESGAIRETVETAS